MTLIELVSWIAVLTVVLADTWLIWKAMDEQERRINRTRAEIDRLKSDLNDTEDLCDALTVKLARMETENGSKTF